MGKHSARLVAVLSVLCLGLPAAGASAKPRKPIKMPRDYAAWSKVAVCESGGWVVLGSAYPDSLGITATNFAAFGGRSQPAGPVPVAARVAQIRVADRLIHRYGIEIPDQHGCAGSW